MSRKISAAIVAASVLIGGSGTAYAADDPQAPGKIAIAPIVDARLRYETVDQPATEADALTFRLRAGIEAKAGKLSFLAEGEGTLALADDYNAFPFPIASNQRRPQFSVVADPENIELNRLQVAYRDGGNALTLGRQRINIDDQRWVGSVGWRQNEQTCDAVRGEAKIGPVGIDMVYAIDQRTVFGDEAGARTSYDGDFVFVGGSGGFGPFKAKLFAYLIDYDEPFFLANSSQTYGILLNGGFPVGSGAKIDVKASYARQSDYGSNPFDYAADYWLVEGQASISGFAVTAGRESLGSDAGRSVQTPMATLHKFNGWADTFLTTPAAGLQDVYVGAKYSFDGIAALKGLNAGVTYHSFDSDIGGIDYGDEWDASIGFTVGKITLLAKYADYNAGALGVDTRKFWLQAGWSY